MSDEDDLGPINVRMGNNNAIGHIGHIVFQKPPPDPNSIFLDGEVIGTMGSAPQKMGETTFFFSKLFTDRFLRAGTVIVIQGVKLRLRTIGSGTGTSIGGRPEQVTLWNVTCEAVA